MMLAMMSTCDTDEKSDSEKLFVLPCLIHDREGIGHAWKWDSTLLTRQRVKIAENGNERAGHSEFGKHVWGNRFRLKLITSESHTVTG